MNLDRRNDISLICQYTTGVVKQRRIKGERKWESLFES